MWKVLGFLTVCCVCLLSAHAQGEKTKVKGLITARTGETLVLKTASANSVTVVLDDDTKVQQPKGLIGVRKQQMSMAILIPGLKISVEGVRQEGPRGEPHAGLGRDADLHALEGGPGPGVADGLPRGVVGRLRDGRSSGRRGLRPCWKARQANPFPLRYLFIYAPP